MNTCACDSDELRQPGRRVDDGAYGRRAPRRLLEGSEGRRAAPTADDPRPRGSRRCRPLGSRHGRPAGEAARTWSRAP